MGSWDAAIRPGAEADAAVPVGDAATEAPADLSFLDPPTPGWAAALAVGQWMPVANTSMSSVEPSTMPPGNTGPASKVGAWTSFVVDPTTSNVYSAANGGHSDYAGNEVDVLELEHDPPRWVNRVAPTPAAEVMQGPYYADGRPSARHTYYGVTFDQNARRIMLFSGSMWMNGYSTRTVDSFNVDTSVWSPKGTHPDVPSTIDLLEVAPFVYAPPTGDVYLFSGFGVHRWTRITNTWSTLVSDAAPYGQGAATAYDTKRDRILLVGGNVNEHHSYDVASNTVTAITLTGSDAATIAVPSGAQMMYVAAIDRFLVRLGEAGGTVYQIDPVTYAVSKLATTGGASVPATVNGPYRKFLYVPRLKGCIYVPVYDGPAWFVRVH